MILVPQVVQAILLIGLPWLFIIGCRHNRLMAWLSPVVLCYLTGMIAGNVPGLPIDKALSTTLTTASVVLAIPLLLFGTDFGRWLRLARSTVVSFLLCLVAVCIAASATAWFLDDGTVPYWQLAGMMVGMFTGGTPNMTAIGKALAVDPQLFVLVSASEIVVSGVYFMFLMTFAQRLYLKFLPAFKKGEAGIDEPDWLPDFSGLERRHQLYRLLIASVLSIVIAALSAGVVYLVLGHLSDAPVLLLITTLAIVGSFFKPIRTLPGSYELGQYLLLIFSLSIGTLADFATLVESSSAVFLYCSIILVVSTILHLIFVAVARIDADTVIITATASVFGPAFIGPIAGAIKNREVVVSGLTTGLVGYAVGNYLGLAVAWLLKP